MAAPFLYFQTDLGLQSEVIKVIRDKFMLENGEGV